ncbi:hypothetical protein BFW01_g8018 [Lasiodiplodia theobromae]|nr:hypothetical protein BFW01_g8018 [Lasiodiplodia theobromae]
MLGLPCAHWNGNAHPASRATSSWHPALVNSSLNIIALLHARELSSSRMPCGHDPICVSQDDDDEECGSSAVGVVSIDLCSAPAGSFVLPLVVAALGAAAAGARVRSSASFHASERRNESSSLGSAWHRSDTPGGSVFTTRMCLLPDLLRSYRTPQSAKYLPCVSNRRASWAETSK